MTRPLSKSVSTPHNTRWVADENALRAVVAELRGVELYGVDTEFMRERTYYPQLALIQLSWRGDDGVEVALIDPLEVDVHPLAEVFAGPGTAIIHAGAQDLPILARATGASPSSIFETQIAGGFLGLGLTSLGRLVSELLGFEVEKGDQLADWLRRPLSDSMRTYAASDVAHLLDLRKALLDRLAERGRAEWALEESERFRQVDRTPVELTRAWWKLKGKARFRGKSRGVAQELAGWRERRARERDMPPNRILPEVSLLAMVQRPPRDRRDLERVRGLNLRGPEAEDVLAAIERGRALREGELDLPPPPPRQEPNSDAVALCQLLIQNLARAEGIEGALIANRDEVSRFVADVTADGSGTGSSSRIASGWRYDLAGARCEEVLAGRSALAFDGESVVLVPTGGSLQES